MFEQARGWAVKCIYNAVSPQGQHTLTQQSHLHHRCTCSTLFCQVVATNPDLSCGRDRMISQQQKQTVSAVILKVIYRRFISQPQNGTFSLETLTVASKNRRFISLANLFDEWATVWLCCVCAYLKSLTVSFPSVLQQPKADVKFTTVQWHFVGEIQ